MDPLAHLAPGWSPYNYSFNNPNKFIDPDGRFPLAIPLLIYGGELLISATVSAFVTVEVVNAVTDGAIYKDKVVNTARTSYDENKQNVTTKNPAAQKKAESRYNSQMEQQPPPDNSGDNKGGNGKNKLGPGVGGGTAAAATAKLVEQCVDEKKGREAAKKQKEALEKAEQKPKEPSKREIKKDENP